MSGKEKAENFDDDFELDALDEASWTEDESTLSGSEAGEPDLGSGSPEVNVAKEKKSGGGFLVSIIVLALLGGGSFYAYQAGLIPGVDPGAPKAGDSVMPVLGTDDTTEATSDLASDVMEGEAMPPMPDAQGDGSVIASDSVSESDILETSTSSLQDQDGALTPMVDLEADTALNLAPLDTSEGEVDVAQVAEKDGMLFEDVASVPEAPVATTGGKLSDGVMAIPGAPEEIEDGADIVTEAPDSDVLSLDESTLLGETEKAPESASVAEDMKPDADDGLSELSGDLTQTQASETATGIDEALVSEGEVSDSAPMAEAGAPVEAPSEPVVDAIPSSKDDASALASKADEAAVAPVKTPAPAKEEPVVADAPKATASEASPAAAPKASDTAKASVPKPTKAVVAPQWTLKSAKPGVAVLYDKRTGDVKTVEVGNRVSGLGTVKSVSKVNGKWVVQGTGGKVTQ